MRSIVIPFLFCLTLWAVALPRDGAPEVSLLAPHPLTPGALVTVKVEGAPPMTEAAFFDLGPNIRGLQLYPAGEGRWEGSFAVLPSMVGQHFKARANLYDANRRPIPVRDSHLAVQVSSAPARQPGVIAETADGRVAVAFDETIRLDTVEVRTVGQSEGEELMRPELRNNYLVLPAEVKAGQIVAVTAQSIRGQEIVLRGPANRGLALSSAP